MVISSEIRESISDQDHHGSLLQPSRRSFTLCNTECINRARKTCRAVSIRLHNGPMTEVITGEYRCEQKQKKRKSSIGIQLRNARYSFNVRYHNRCSECSIGVSDAAEEKRRRGESSREGREKRGAS